MAQMLPGGHLSEDGRSVIVTLIPGLPETGLWCGSCLLPSVIRVPVYTLAESGPRLLLAATECTECGPHGAKP